MKIKLNKLIKIVQSEITRLYDNAAYSGSMTDNGSSKLNDSLSMFIHGIYVGNPAFDNETEIECPEQFRKIVDATYAEYNSYLELKKKYEDEL
jgi:hypothetical protein